MIIEIEHIKNNKYSIKVDNKEKFFAGKTWIDKQLDSNSYIITTNDEKLLYYSKEQNLHHYILNDENNNTKVKISKNNIEIESHKYICYEKAIGRLDNISIYEKDKQISQVVFPQNVGKFYIFLLPEYENLDSIISMYSILCNCFSLWDYKNPYNSHPVGFRYTYSKDDKYYNSDWINNNFDKYKIDEIYKEIN